MKNFLYITAVLVHMGFAEWAYYNAYLSNKATDECGAHWALVNDSGELVDCINWHVGLYDLWLAIAWFFGAVCVFGLAHYLKLNLASKIIGGFFAYSTWCNVVDYSMDPTVATKIEWFALGLYITLSIIAVVLWVTKWKRSKGS